MSIRGLVFDLGHTLMHLNDTWPAIFARGAADLAAFLHSRGPGLDGEAFARTLLDLRREGFARARETLREVTAWDSMCRTFAHFGLPDPDPVLVEAAIDAFFAYENTCWVADPVALPLLQELAGRGLRLGLFSNATHDPLIQHQVDRFGFRPWLDPALSSARVGVRKPDPAAFAPFLEAWGLPPESVAVVGDTLEADILGAQRAGMWGVWLRSRQQVRQEGGGYDEAGQPDPIVPDATIGGLEELPACLERL